MAASGAAGSGTGMAAPCGGPGPPAPSPAGPGSSTGAGPRVCFAAGAAGEAAEEAPGRRQGKVTVRYDRRELRKRLHLEEWILAQLTALYDCRVPAPGPHPGTPRPPFPVPGTAPGPPHPPKPPVPGRPPTPRDPLILGGEGGVKLGGLSLPRLLCEGVGGATLGPLPLVFGGAP